MPSRYRFALVLCCGLLSLLSSVAPAADCPTARVAVSVAPHGGATDAVVREVHAAADPILVQAYSFISAPIAQSLDRCPQMPREGPRGARHVQRDEAIQRGYIPVNAGIQTRIDDQHAIAHSKVLVIDSATVITGSFNFTKAAEASNAENLLVIKEAPELVQAYEANVQAHAAHSHPYIRKASTAAARASAPVDTREVHGNRNSKVYRVPGCKGYAGMRPASVVPFATEAEAQQAGYRRAKDCP